MAKITFTITAKDEDDNVLDSITFTEEDNDVDLTIEFDYMEFNQTLEHVGTRPRDRE